MKSFNLSEWAVRHAPFTLFLIALLAVSGTFAYLKLGRAEDPDFTIKVSTITVVWPGATAQEMRDQVSDVIETKMQELPNLDKIETFSKPGVTAIEVVFKDSTPPSEIPTLFYQLRKKLHDLAPTLPPGVLAPTVNDEWQDVDSILLAVSSETADYRMLKDVTQMLRKRLVATPGAQRVKLYGEQAQRIFIDFDPARLAVLGIEPEQIFASITKQNAIAGTGTFETTSSRVRIQISDALRTARQIAAIPYQANGKSFVIGDIAKVMPGFEDPPSFKVRSDNKNAVLLGVVMAKGSNIITFGRDIDTALNEVRTQIPVGIDLSIIADQPKVVSRAIGEFTTSFVEALVIVLGVSFVSLGLRAGFVVALSVPLVLTITMLAMYALAIDLQRISLGALIIALGLLVDDAIIAVEMMVVKMGQGWTRIAAASYAWKSTAFPMLAGTLVTAAGFLPVGFAASSTGEYTGTLFWVLMISLLASWLVAIYFVPYLGTKFLRTSGVEEQEKAHLYDSRFYRWLRRVVTWSVNHRYLVVASTASALMLGAVGFLHVQKQFFPLSDRTELFVQIRLPEGSSFSATAEATHQAEKLLHGDEDVVSSTSYIGEGASRFWMAMKPELRNEAFAEIVVVTHSLDARERVKQRLEQRLADGALPQARIRVMRFNFGPPVGFPVQFRVLGDDLATVREIAYRVREQIGRDKEVLDPHLDWNEKTPRVRLELDQARIRLLSLTPADISARIQMLLLGASVTSLRDGTEQIQVVARAGAPSRQDISQLQDLPIAWANGSVVTVGQVSRLVYESEEPIYWRRNRETMISVRADVADGVQAPDVSSRLWTSLESVRNLLPPGYRIELGGAIEESIKANVSIFAIFPVMIAMMMLIIMIQLQNMSRLCLVMMSAPLGIIGASLSLNLMHAPFGFVALLGLIALLGMEMRNSIILVDQVRQDIESGASNRDAIIGATVRRARPVALTALTAILAMVPLSRSIFWGPMAITIMGGLSLATLFTVLFLPALYAIWLRVPSTPTQRK
ncbi:efflux RND transporter permease subunit [Labrys sp. KB_33_2]|uniref:efflux RND transporter permease subunit n=1 Tax=Labrys sp. KB_33_2 TaxID=3237479 RepID=UPI003F8FE2C4